MANAEHNWQVRHKHTTKNLNYGHFGTATYEESSHRWRFLRQTPNRPQEGSMCPESYAFQLVHEHFQRLEMNSVQPYNAVHKTPTTPGTSKNLLKHVPESVSAVPSLPVPSHSEMLHGQCQPENTGEILAFGHARVLRDGGFRSHVVPIVAFPVGTGGETVRLLGIDTSRFVPHDEFDARSTWHVPCISTSRVGHWRQSTDRILQISYCTSHKQTHLLIRQSGGTSILRPIITSGISSGLGPSNLGSTRFQPNASPIDPNHVLTIPCSRTGGHDHADAMFNPLNPNVLAIIDVNGQWSVWKLRGKEPLTSRVTLKAQLLQQGNMFNTEAKLPIFNQNIDLHGWYRMCWLNNSRDNTDNILVCSRVSASVFDTRGALVDHADMRLGPPSDGIVILDLAQSRRDGRLIYVLSASRLQIFSSAQMHMGGVSRMGPLNLVCGWSHFRDEHDLGLKMSVVEYLQSTYVFLYSPSSPAVTAYQFQHSNSGSSIEYSWGPTTLQWPKTLKERVKAILNLAIVPVDFRVNNRDLNTLEWGVVKMVASTFDGEVHEAFYRHKIDSVPRVKEDNNVVALSQLPEAIQKRYLSSRLVEDDDLDDFIVRDETEDDYGQGINSKLVEALNTDALALSQGTESRLWGRILDYETLQGDEDHRPTIPESLNQVSQRLTGPWNKALPMSTLARLLREPRVLDLETASQDMDQWLSMIRAADHMHIQATSSHSRTLLADIQTTSLLAFYDTYLLTYISSLSPHVTDRNRVNREKIVRQAATDAFLSGIGLLLRRQSPDAENEIQSPDSQMHPSYLPLLSSQSFASATPAVPDDSAVSRLHTFANFRQSAAPPLLKASVTVSNILGHLPTTINNDPTTYSYETTNKKIQEAQDEEAELSLDPRERARVRKQAAKRLRNLGKQVQFSQDIHTQRSMPPIVTNRRLAPALPGREFRSSQPAVPDSSQSLGQGAAMVNMSQPERGVHGTRPAKKKAAKAMPGF